MADTPALILPDVLNPAHAAMLRELHFETVGVMQDALVKRDYDHLRVVYAITNPEQTEIVYIGESERGRNLRGRLRAHMDSRRKQGLIELMSAVFVHVMVTEFMALDIFEQDNHRLPKLNRRKIQRDPPRAAHRQWLDPDVRLYQLGPPIVPRRRQRP